MMITQLANWPWICLNESINLDLSQRKFLMPKSMPEEFPESQSESQSELRQKVGTARTFRRRFKSVIPVLMVAIALAFNSPARADDFGHFPEMLDYNQLMSLTPIQRQAYVTSIQAMLVDLSANSVGFVDQAQRDVAWSEFFLPEAAAEVGAAPTAAALLHQNLHTTGRSPAVVGAPVVLVRGPTTPPTLPPVAPPPAPQSGPPAPAPASAPEAGGCRTQPFTCKSDTRVKRRKNFESLVQNGIKNCIYAGNKSTYVLGAKRCTPIYGMDLTLDAGGTKHLSCVQPRVLCNPLIFGVKGDVENPQGLCVKSQMEVTKDCAAKSSPASVMAFLSGKDGQGSKFRLAESWNQLKEFVTSACGETEQSAVFHCVECNVIMKRLHEAKLGAWSGGACDGRTFQMTDVPRNRAPTSRPGVNQ